MATRGSGRVLVDTSVWIDFFRKAEPAWSEVSALMEKDRICSLGIVVAELMQSARSEKELAVLEDFVHVFAFLPELARTWEEAGRLSWLLRKKGKTVGLADCYIAVAAGKAGVAIYSRDSHFEMISVEAGIRLHGVGP